MVSGARMVTFDWRMLPGTMNGLHSIGDIALSSVIRSISPRSSHLNFLPEGNFLHSCSASFSPGSIGVVSVAPRVPDGGAAVGPVVPGPPPGGVPGPVAPGPAGA